MLVDFYEHFQSAHEAVRRRHQDDNAVIGAFLDACDAAGVAATGGEVGQAIDELRAHHRDREKALS